MGQLCLSKVIVTQGLFIGLQKKIMIPLFVLLISLPSTVDTESLKM